MLYERWRKIAAERRDEIALSDFASGKRRTFGELFAAGERQKTGPTGMVFPQGHSPEFIFELLAAWRENKISCPLEPGQGKPGSCPGQPVRCLARPIVQLKSTSAT